MKNKIYVVNDKLSFGCGETCAHNGAKHDIAVVHACKEPCHRRAAGYSTRTLDKDDPHYLAVETDGHLYLNLIDPPVPLFQPESFALFFDFADRMMEQGRAIHIHCNQGQSRAPSLTLLYMAKRLGILPHESYQAAREAFERSFPYNPGKGIVIFLTQNWQDLGRD